VQTPSRRVVLAANSSWNIVNFRGGLIRALKAEGYEPVVIAPVDPAAEHRMNELGVERIVIDITRSGLNPFADLALLLKYRSLLKSLRPVAYLGFTIKPNIYGGIAARLTGVPLIANVSGLGTVFINRGPLLALVSRLYRLALKRAAIVFFQNPDDLELFVERGLVRRSQAGLLPGSGIDLDAFQPSPLPLGPATFLLIGRMLGDKGVREFVEAARHLRPDLPDARFQLLGPLDEGNRSAITRAELNRWVEEGIVEYLGSTDDVRPYLERATVAVLPSYREGLPRSLLEAAAMGRPLIATDVPGCRDLIEDGANGTLCKPKASGSLANAMQKLAKMPRDRLGDMGSASRRLVEKRYSQTVVIGAYLDALGKLLVSRS
jgi:glycosyltransferase involved in cell wall biosynthesis